MRETWVFGIVDMMEQAKRMDATEGLPRRTHPT